MAKKYNLILNSEEFKNKILFLETSESKMSPEKFKKAILKLKENSFFNGINGLILGKPQDNVYLNEYDEILKELIDKNIPIITNFNIGHAYPKCILLYGAKVKFNLVNKSLDYLEEFINE
ncbi:UNVERIFIED_CONTAM: hypothetical protein O8I53_09710 [Campylobacter lari]